LSVQTVFQLLLPRNKATESRTYASDVSMPVLEWVCIL